MMPPTSARSFALLVVVSGCAADPAPDDYPRTEPVVSRRTAAWSEADRPESSPEAKDLEARLYMDDAGKLVANAMRAHGGWDAWRSLRKISYVRAAVSGKEEPEPVRDAGGSGGAPAAMDRDRFELLVDPRGACPCRPGAHPPHPVPAGREDVRDALPREYAIASLPFSLVADGLQKQHLGVELDPRTGELLEKLNVAVADGAGREWMVVYFDAGTAAVRRVLAVSATGTAELVFLSDEKEAGGIRIPTRRQVHELPRQNAHIDRLRPARIETLTDLVTESR